MVDYVRMAATAQRLITKNGRSIQFARPDNAPANANRPWKGPLTGEEAQPLTINLMGVFVPPNTVRQFGLTALGEGTEYRDLVTYSQQIIITAPGEQDLREFISVIDRDERWGIIGLQVLRPADITLLAFVGVRR